MKSFAENLNISLGELLDNICELLEQVPLQRLGGDLGFAVILSAPEHSWGEPPARARRLQHEVLAAFRPWRDQVGVLTRHLDDATASEVTRTLKLLESWCQLDGWSVHPPGNSRDACKRLRSDVAPLRQALEALTPPGSAEMVLVPDTNALLHCRELQRYNSTAGQATFTVAFLPTVLKELDRLKIEHRNPDVREKAKKIITFVKGLRTQGPLYRGVTVHRTVTVRSVAVEPDMRASLPWFDSSNEDDRLLASTLELQVRGAGSRVLLVTRDINLQNKAEFAHLPFAEPPDP